MFRALSDPRFCNGLTQPGSHATQGYIAPSSFSSGTSGGPHSPKILGNTSLHCTVCARNKPSNQPPAGQLHPLSTPSRPWSHIALDFITGLPPSAGNAVILTIIDRFSKAAHSGLERVLQLPGRKGQSILGLSSSEQRPVRAGQPRTGDCPALRRLHQSNHLE